MQQKLDESNTRTHTKNTTTAYGSVFPQLFLQKQVAIKKKSTNKTITGKNLIKKKIRIFDST